ncbi:MAG TPA: iron ABC transporter substrate-binding protein [Acidimicrobiales bacterium]|nr:iron ABC transporter substrate-binding protein [Acidimicrobiales bacterium]
MGHQIMRRTLTAVLAAAALLLTLTACSGDSGPSLTVYSGRTEDLVGPLFERFEAATGVKVKVRYGDSAEVSGAVLEEGDRPKADILIVQDAGNLGQVNDAGRLAPLPQPIVDRVPVQFRSPEGRWVGLSGRSRVVAYNTDDVQEADLPASIDGFTDPKWKGRLAWAPTNGSFQAFVTAFRVLEGEDKAEAWLRGMKANEPRVFPNNLSIVEAVGRGEIDAGLVNHYYLFRLRAEGKAGKAENKYFGAGDPGGLVNVAGAGILQGSKKAADAARLIEFLISDESQRYFAEKTFELPVVPTVEADPQLPDIEKLAKPEVELSKLDDAKGTVALLTRLQIL